MKTSIFKNASIFIACMTAILFAATAAWAHRVIVFGYVEGDTVYTESKFSGGKKAQNSQITVYDSQGKKVAEGRTDQNGAFAFKPPRPMELKIVLDSGAGHRAEWVIPKSDFGTVAADDASVEKTPPSPTIAQTPAETAAPGLTADEIRAVVADELEKKIKPIRQMLLENQTKGPSLHDILGGVGYIFGLMGVAAYFYSKKSKNDQSR